MQDGMGQWVKEEIELFRNKYNEPIPVEHSEVEDEFSQGEMLEEEDLGEMLEHVALFYEDLLDVDMDDDFLAEIKENTVYNPSDEFKRTEKGRLRRKHMRESIFGFGGKVTGAGTGLHFLGEFIPEVSGSLPMEYIGLATGLAAIGTIANGISKPRLDPYYRDLKSDEIHATYYVNDSMIGITSSLEHEANAYSIGASEVFHHFQKVYNSDTNGDDVFEEGLERASRMKAIDHFYRNDVGSVTEKQRDTLKLNILVNGYLASLDSIDMLDEDIVSDLNLGDSELFCLGKYKGETGTPDDYDRGAISILNLDRYDDNVFSEVFHRGRDGLIDKQSDAMADRYLEIAGDMSPISQEY